MQEISNIKARGFLTIKDKETGEILVEKDNAIHYENLSIGLAQSLANRDTGWIHEMHFGNGAATVNGVGVVTYLPPNTTSQSADLYNPTYYKVIDDNSPLNTDPTKNFMEINHTTNQLFSDIVITCTLDFGEPTDQAVFDDTTTNEGIYVFDELGLKAFGANPTEGLLLTHVVFHPVQKSLNRIIEVVYTIRLSLV